MKFLKSLGTALSMVVLLLLIFLEITLGNPFPITFFILGIPACIFAFRGEKNSKVGVLVYVLVLAFLVAWYWVRYEIAISNGDKIVVAIEQYQKDHGIYPGKLEELLPVYLESLPNPLIGPQEYHYRLNKKNNSFFLQFNLAVFDSCMYVVEKKDWQCHD